MILLFQEFQIESSLTLDQQPVSFVDFCFGKDLKAVTVTSG